MKRLSVYDNYNSSIRDNPGSADFGGYRDIGWIDKIDCSANEKPVFRTVVPQKSVIDKTP